MTPFPKLELLRVEGKLEFDEVDKSIVLLVGFYPSLTRFWMAPVREWLRKALWGHCYFLDSIGHCEEGAIEAWRKRRAEGGHLPLVVTLH